MGWAYGRLGRNGEATELLERTVELTSGASFYLGCYGWALGLAGRQDEAREVLARLEERAESEHVRSLYRAWILGSLGKIDRALDMVELAFREVDPWLSFPNIPPFDSFRAEPRFIELLRVHHQPRPEPPEALKTSHAIPERLVLQPDGKSSINESEPIAEASVAVLPFTDMSPARDQDWFCEGMAEELINGLSGIEGLRVAARASAFQLKGKPLRAIGEALRVATVLDGSVRSAGDKLRITVQLNNVSDGYQKWSARYDRNVDDVFAVQDEIAASIVEALEVELGGDATPALNRNTDNLEAYREYLQGRHLWLQRKPDSVARAKAHFEAALEADPGYALAHTGLADLYSVQALYGFAPSEEVAPRAARAAEEAVAVDPELSEAHASLIFVRGFLEWDWEAASKAVEKSIELNRSNVIAHLWGACVEQIRRSGARIDDLLERAQELDPLSPYVAALSALAISMAHRDDEAFALTQRGLELNPDYPVLLFTQAFAAVRTGQADRAVARLERGTEITGRAPFYLGLLGWKPGRGRERARRPGGPGRVGGTLGKPSMSERSTPPGSIVGWPKSSRPWISFRWPSRSRTLGSPFPTCHRTTMCEPKRGSSRCCVSITIPAPSPRRN